MKRTIFLASLFALAGALHSDATQLVRELWDNIPIGQLKGATNGTTSLGFYPSAGVKWVVNPGDTGGTTPGGATNVLQVISDDIQDWHLGLYDELPPSVSTAGTLGLQSGNTNGWDSGSWAVRMLAPGSAVNFSANGTYYFSARMIKRGLWWNSNGTNGYGCDDAALGFGLASGSATSSHFVGAGFTRTVAVNGGGGYVFDATDIGDSVYITTGTLGQSGLAGHPGDSGGPYYVQAYSTNKLQWVEGYIGGFPSLASTWVNGGFLVGKITTTTSGNSEVDVRIYVAADPIDQTDGAVSWDARYSFNETANMNYLLVWMHGNNSANPCYIDGIRVATTWAEAVGEEIVGPPAASPTNTVYAGTPIVLSAAAAVNASPGEFQWMLYGTNIPGANDATYTNDNPAVADSGPYSVTFQNEFGAAASPSVTVTSQVQTVTVLPAVPPFVTVPPGDVTRYAGAPAAFFSVSADGAQPLTYQWKQVAGGTTNVLADQTNQTLTLSPVQATNAGSYFVTITNWIGATNSALAALNVIAPSPGGYAEAVIANSPYAYWRMDETNGTVLHDYFAGYDGTVLDPTNITLGVAAAAGIGFPPGHRAVFIPNNGFQARVNLPPLPGYSNTMTFACWLYAPSSPTANGLIFNRDLGNNGGYGNANGLMFTSYVPTPGVTNYNQLGYQWGTYQWTNSGLCVPTATWTFVALVLNGTQATMYMGTNSGPLTVATATLPSALDAAFPGTTYSNSYPVMIGRTGWPWADTSANNAWANASVSMSDLAIFYSALPASSVNNLYLSALGEAITCTGSGGSLLLSWPQGTLQSASEVQGTYTNVPGATSPHPVSTTEARKFYRVQR